MYGATFHCELCAGYYYIVAMAVLIGVARKQVTGDYFRGSLATASIKLVKYHKLV